MRKEILEQMVDYADELYSNAQTLRELAEGLYDQDCTLHALAMDISERFDGQVSKIIVFTMGVETTYTYDHHKHQFNIIKEDQFTKTITRDGFIIYDLDNVAVAQYTEDAKGGL